MPLKRILHDHAVAMVSAQWFDCQELRSVAQKKMVLIRISQPTDFDAAGALLVASYTKLLSSGYSSEILGRALPHITRPKPELLACGTYYVAETDQSKVVGCGGWTPEEPGSGKVVDGEAHIRHFAVHPESVQRGIGASLLLRCFRDARSAGIRKLYCISTLNAVHFYQAFDFHRVGPIDVPLEPGFLFPCVLMRRDALGICHPAA
jgi:ribosomal protein S18 acetylase RimI-like enzyme